MAYNAVSTSSSDPRAVHDQIQHVLEGLADLGLSEGELAEYAAEVYACAEELEAADVSAMWVPQHWSDGEDGNEDTLQAAFNATPDRVAVCSAGGGME